MSYPELILTDDQFAEGYDLESLAEKRASLIQQIIDDFIEYYEREFEVTVDVIENASQKLSLLYFTICYQEVKPLVNDKANRYKMASLMGLLIVKHQILIHPDSGDNPRLNRSLNAKFAMAVGFSIIDCMIVSVKTAYHFDTSNVAVNESVKKVIDDHELWLTTKNLNDLPMMINSQFLELLDIMLRASYEIH